MRLAVTKRCAALKLGVAAALAPLCMCLVEPVNGADPSSGKYCIGGGSTMLVTRSNSNGKLDFGISIATPQGMSFGVAGSAQPDANGWRFRQNMNAADPAQRCEVLIGRLPNGGYSFSVTQAGTCESQGGFRTAPPPNYKLLFPATSREGALPRNKSVAEAISLESGGISCANPR